jgi:tetratricopeptide (TPR) repeat protein
MPRPYDFNAETKRIVAQRVNYVCSNPDCLALTSSTNDELTKSTLTGQCAHINTGSDWGPRPSDKSTEYLKSAENAIWLCCNCHTLIDRDESRYPAEILIEWRQSTEARIRKWIVRNDSPFRRLQELTQAGSVADDDFDLLFNFFRKDLELSSIMNENDSTLKLLEFFDCFHTRLTLTNQFYYYDVLAQIYNNIGNIVRAKEYLEKALVLDVHIPKKVFNRGLLAYLNHEFEKVKQIAVDLIDQSEYYYPLLVLGVNDLNELISLDTQISNGGVESQMLV